MSENVSKGSTKKLLIAVGVVALGVAWYAFRPERLVVDSRVNEGFPQAVAAEAAGRDVQPMAVASGQFHGVAHETKGTATIYGGAGGQRTLRLTEFTTSNGPDVQVYLVAAPDAKDNDTVKNAGFVGIGSLKGNIGDQNYEIPTSVDLAKYRCVTIWCKRFGVNFGTAPLTAADARG